MTNPKLVRRLAGVATLLVLLGLIVADTLYQSITLAATDKMLLVSLVSGLLAVDIAVQQSWSNAARAALEAGLSELVTGGEDDD